MARTSRQWQPTPRRRSRRTGGVLAGPLPDDSVLTLEEYLDVQRAIGNETRFGILPVLKERGDMSASDLKEVLGLEANNLHYHLDKLVDVGLAQNRKRETADREGLFSYYRATALGNGVLEHGVEELMRREHEFLNQYAEWHRVNREYPAWSVGFDRFRHF